MTSPKEAVLGVATGASSGAGEVRVGGQGGALEALLDLEIVASVPGRELTRSRCKKILTKSQNGQGLWLNMGFRPAAWGVRLPMQDWGSSRLLEREARKAGKAPHSRSFVSKTNLQSKPAIPMWPMQHIQIRYNTEIFSCPLKFLSLPPLNSCLHQAKFTQTLASCHHRSLLGINQGLHSKHLLWREPRTSGPEKKEQERKVKI